MAEIWLGRLTGPFGFERVVVCKRIFPHLARRAEFVSMFVDEARIASGIQHSNVVQVQELVQEDGELFLVMEYLAGESLGSLLRRLASRGERLDPALAAHVVAEACAGLHAAHELTDEQGFPRDLVHRDISPQNIFITYSGQVKLLDFGIAKAADRMTQTEAGQVKGKFAYMSPEQCQGKALDRRSDVFSMGIVLWEALSGARFARQSELLTFQAICDEPTPQLQGPAAGHSALVEACRAALDKNKLRRFPTAVDLRTELLPFVQRSFQTEHPDQALAALMERLFPERIDAKRDLLLELKAGRLPQAVPSAEVDETVDIPTLHGPSEEADGGALSSPAAGDRDVRPPNRHTRPMWIGLGAMALVVGALGVAQLLSDQEPPSGEPRAPQASAEPEQIPSSTSRPTMVQFSVETTPAGAMLKLGPKGALRSIGPTPTNVELTPSDSPLVLELSLQGYRTHSETLVPNMNQRVVVALQRSAPAHSPAKAPRSATRASAAKPSEPKPIPRFR